MTVTFNSLSYVLLHDMHTSTCVPLAWIWTPLIVSHMNILKSIFYHKNNPSKQLLWSKKKKKRKEKPSPLVWQYFVFSLKLCQFVHYNKHNLQSLYYIAILQCPSLQHTLFLGAGIGSENPKKGKAKLINPFLYVSIFLLPWASLTTLRKTLDKQTEQVIVFHSTPTQI